MIGKDGGGGYVDEKYGYMVLPMDVLGEWGSNNGEQ